MMEEVVGVKQSGKFKLTPSGKNLHGELTLAGSKTSLYLNDETDFDVYPVPGRCVTGILHDLTKITLLNCVTIFGTGTGTRGGERYHFAKLFPHFALYGDRHIAPDDQVVTGVDFVVDDASTLFYDFDAFGCVIDARPYIDQIAHANRLNREIQTGPDPQIVYFTGKREIFSAETVLGRVSALHNPTHPLGGPDGVRLENTISVSIRFGEPLLFREAMTRTATLNSYLGMLVGRPQNITDLGVRLAANGEKSMFLRVYWSMPPRRDPLHEEDKPHPADVLLDAVHQPNVFSGVLRSWLQTHADRREARGRFFGCFANQNRYSTDRLVAAANMFHILPSSAVPVDVELSEEQKSARDAARKAFRALPPSAERDSVLGALGRMGKSSLKHKIRHRAKWVLDHAGAQFPELTTVCDEAVNCRNFYVHGTEPVFDYEANSDARSFFADTLEWVFAASDLVEAGWNIDAWLGRGSSMSSQFARYHVNYRLGLQELNRLLSAARQASAS
jgi:ApeA N-terminal domain 1/Apea-like HEPN